MKNQNLLPVLLKAVDNARDGITICDATQPDFPLVFVNEGFLSMTGYSREEVIGNNCRFLQGGAPNEEALHTLRQGLQQQQPVVVKLLNYHKNGKPFWNKLSVTPIRDTQGIITHFVGVQDDITAEVEKEQLERQLEQHRLITAVTIEAQEAERRLLGAELHDNINQMLASVRLFLDLAASDENLRMKMIKGSADIIDKTIAEVRNLSHRLVGPSAGNLPLQDLLKELLATVKTGAAFTISFECATVDESKIPDNKKIILYRIAQEQLQNIIKHASARHVAVKIEETANELRLFITDDGVGFNANKKTKGIGLRNIEARLQMVNGRMHVMSSVGNGCSMEVAVPI